MNDLLLPWTTRGVRYDTREYLSSTPFTEREPAAPPDDDLRPNLTLADAVPVIRRKIRDAAFDGPPAEYGCFDLDGTLVEPGMRFQRQVKNILYYMISGYFNVARNKPEIGGGPILLGVAEPIPNTPGDGQWGVMISEACESRAEILEALTPLIDHRHGRVVETPSFEDVGFFQNWLSEIFAARQLPPYLLICDDFANISLEIQFVFNALAVTGRLYFDHPDDYAAYAEKVLRVERRRLPNGKRCVLASPQDDTVTFVDCENLVKPALDSHAGKSLDLEPLLGAQFDEGALHAAARECRFLGLYSHGLGLEPDQLEQRPDLAGAFVLVHDSMADEGLLTADELIRDPFVPGGIFFSPACLAGGLQGNSDYASWIDPGNLTRFCGTEARLSSVADAVLRNPDGPVAFLAHFDISMASNAPMTNSMFEDRNLQTMLHEQFFKHLNQGACLGRATKPFRWAAGSYYSRSIETFSQLTGTLPIDPESAARPVADIVRSMCRDHVTATDYRNFVILGDPAVRLPAGNKG